MRLLLVLVAFTAVSIPAVEGYAQAEGEERDRTTERVERAEADYAQSVEFARGELIEALNEAVYRAADQGDLEELETLEAQRTAFEEEGELPASREVRREALAYHRAMERAADDLGNAYERAIRDYTRERRIDEARMMRIRKTLLENGTRIDRVEFGGHEYALVDLQTSWHEAQEICESLGGNLVCVGSAEELVFVQSLIPDTHCWLGLTDEEREGEWRWVDGSALDFSIWRRSQPDNHRNQQHYSFTGKSGGWDDVAAGDASITCFVCEWSVPESVDDANGDQ